MSLASNEPTLSRAPHFLALAALGVISPGLVAGGTDHLLTTKLRGAFQAGEDGVELGRRRMHLTFEADVD
jgi:hypothetical protein